MNKKTIIVVFFFGVLFISNIYAITLENVVESLSRNKVTSGDFTQTKVVNTSKGVREIKSFGNFVLSTNGIMWNTTRPFPTRLIVTDKKIIQIDSKNNQSTIDGSDNVTFKSISSTIASIFSNDLNIIKEKFICSFSEKDNNIWVLELIPKDNTIKTVINSLILEGTFIEKKCTLTSLVMIEKNENQIKYTFSNQKYSDKIEDEILLSFIE